MENGGGGRVSERIAAAFRESDAFLKTFFRVKILFKENPKLVRYLRTSNINLPSK